VSDNGVVFSLLPKELLVTPRNYTSYLSPDASIYTSIPAGKTIFGGGYAPFVGSPVYVQQPDGTWLHLPENYQPATGNILLIRVFRADPMPKELIFENRFGGFITIHYYNGASKIIGQVLRPVSGVGRFLGTQYTPVGRIRANHSGVIDISTSPFQKFGGIQIVPANHGMSEEMIKARMMSQWMVVGPVNATDPSWENTAPLFSYYLRPSYDRNDLKGNHWMQKTLRRYLVQIRVKGQTIADDEDWQFFKPTFYKLEGELPDAALKVLDHVTAIRILFPVY
jgi:hypothetical protein